MVSVRRLCVCSGKNHSVCRCWGEVGGGEEKGCETTRRVGTATKDKKWGPAGLNPGLKSATGQLCRVSEYRSNEAAP